MSVFSVFHAWVTGQVIDQTNMNGNISTLVTAGNNIDNQNIGVNGIFASQVIPTSGAQATFGGTQAFTFNGGAVVASNNDANVPLSITGNSATQTADYLDITKVGGTTGGIFSVGLSGNVTQLGATILAAPGGALTTQVGVTNDNGGTNGLIANVPAGSTNGFQVNVANVTKAKVGAAGDLQAAPLINAVSVLSRVSPVYTAAGAQVAATQHACQGSVAILAGQAAGITLTNNAVFASATSYAVFACASTNNGGAGENPPLIGNQSGTQFILGNPTARNLTYNWVAFGV